MLPTTQTYTTTIRESTEFNWIIDDFTTQSEIVLSPKFSLATYPDNRLFLGLFPSNSLKIFDEDIFVYLWFAPKNHQQVTLRYRLSILDGAGEKRCTKEFKWTFDQNDNKRCATNYVLRAHLLDENNALLVNDKLTIICEVDVIESEQEAVVNFSHIISKYDKLSSDYETLLKSGMYADLILIDGEGNKHSVHKNILASRSAVFSTLIKQGDMKDFTIANLNQLEMIRFLTFVYSGKISFTDKLAVKLLVVAHQYEILDLTEACEQFLASKITIESALETLMLADKNRAAQLKAKCLGYFTMHSQMIIHTEGWANFVQEAPELVNELIKSLSDCITEHKRILKKD